MGVRHRKNGPISLFVRLTQTTMRYHFTSAGMQKLRRWTITSGDQDVKKLEPRNL